MLESHPPAGQRARRLLLALGLLAVVIAVASFLLEGAEADNGGRPRVPDASVVVSARTLGPRIAPGFVGVSFEYPALTDYTGTDPAHLNPGLENLLRDLAPGSTPVIRIGGNTTDTTWWPTPGLVKPGGVKYSLSPRWVAVVNRLAADTNAKVILGVDLEARPLRLGRTEARALAAGVDRGRLVALELSNEASRYAIFPWYHNVRGRPVFARPRSYGFGSFAAEFGQLAREVPPGVPIAGPTLAGDNWMTHLGWFLARQRRLSLVTFHRYPLNRCFTRPGSPHFPTIPHLLSRSASVGLADPVAAAVALARRHGLPVRLDEINSVACGGKRGVSNTFAAALWALDTLFALARAGVTGVDFHTFPHAAYNLFDVRHRAGAWATYPTPEYYGMTTFALAAPPGSRLLGTHTTARAAVRSWATRATDGTLRVTVINDDLGHGHLVEVRLPAPSASASLLALTAPSPRATSQVTLGGTSFDSQGALAPQQTTAIRRSARDYLVRLGPASAVVLTAHPTG